MSVHEGKDGVIATQPDILAGKELGSALTHKNVAGHDLLIAEFLYPEAFADAVAAVLNAALSLLCAMEMKVGLGVSSRLL